MAFESLSVFACALVLGLIGLGPALWATARGERRVSTALAVAPATGSAIIGLLSFPLARFVAPVQHWAFPVTVALTLASLGLAAWQWRRDPAARLNASQGWSLLGAALWVGFCFAVLVGPLLVRGMQYAAYRANPSDAFLQVSLSETLRVVDWQTLWAGAPFAADNLEAMRRLAEASPTALFTARLVPQYIGLSRAAALSWAAAITGLPVYRLYLPYNLMSLGLAVPAALALGSALRLPRLLKYPAAAAVAFGFWAKFLLDSDAGYEIAALPLMLLAVFAWVQVEQQPRPFPAPPHLLLALALAATTSFYVPLAPGLAIAMLVYYGFAVWQRLRPLSALRALGQTAGTAVLLLVVTGQFDFVGRNWLRLLLTVGNEAQYPPYVLWLIWANDAAALWGMPGTVLWPGLSQFVRWGLQTLAGGLGLFLTVVTAVTAWLVARRSSSPAERIVFAVVAGGAAVALAAYARDNHRVAGKAFTYIYPYLILAPLIFVHYRAVLLKPLAQKYALALLALWLAFQFALGLVLPYGDRVMAVRGGQPRAETYDLSPITDTLDAHRPQRLLVMIPRAAEGTASSSAEGWTFAVYSMFAFAPYQPYFQSGLIVDNMAQAQNLWLQAMTAPPDYAVVLKEVDYIGANRLGTRVAETPELALYRITVADQAVFQEAERALYLEREGETACMQGVCSPPALARGS